MKNTLNKTVIEDTWEDGRLGASEAYVKKVSAAREQAIDEKLGLQMISLRLQQDLIQALKRLAHQEGIGYQPYIRQLLSRHVQEKRALKLVDQKPTTGEET